MPRAAAYNMQPRLRSKKMAVPAASAKPPQLDI
jgi:hypothetical protein